MAVLAPLATVFGTIGVGWLVARVGLLPETAVGVLNRFALHVAFPALAFGALWRAPVEILLEPRLYATHALALVATAIASVALLSAAGATPGARASGSFSAFFGNTTYVGFPLATLAYGPAAAGVAAAVTGLHLLVGLPIGVALLSWSPGAPVRPREVLAPLARLPLFWAVVLGFGAGLARAQAGLPPELPVLDLVGASAPAVALVAVGGFLAATPPGQVRAMPGILASAVVTKLVLLPALVYAVGAALGLDPLLLGVSVLLAGTPTAASAFTLASEKGVAPGLVAGCLVAGTVASAATLGLLLRGLTG